jgi:hypothetical protein
VPASDFYLTEIRRAQDRLAETIERARDLLEDVRKHPEKYPGKRRAERPRPVRDSLVYFGFTAARTSIKIGTTTNIKLRMASLRLIRAVVIPGGYEEEAALHRQFGDYRLHGEWFYPAPVLIEFVNNLKRQGATVIDR